MSNASHGPVDGLKLYRRPMSFWWWLERRVYFKFIIRELTCVFVGAFAVLTLLQIRAVGAGAEAYAAFVDRLATPGWIVFSAVSLLFVLYHSITWFQAVPTTMMIRFGEQRVPDRVIAGAHYVGWVVVSVVIALVVLRG